MNKIIKATSCIALCLALLCSCGGKSCGNPDCTCDSKSDEKWKPNAAENWNFTPILPVAVINPNEYYTLDLDYSLEETEFEKVPEYLTLKLVNKSGDPPLCQSYFFIEKQCNSFDLGDDGAVGYTAYGAWARIPFIFKRGDISEEESTAEIKINLKDNLKADYEFTPGCYRLVFFQYDGSASYIDFSIKSIKNK